MRTLGILVFSLTFATFARADENPISPEKVQAAAEAEEAGAYAAAQALYVEVLHDADKLDENDPRRALAREQLGTFYLDSDHRNLETARNLLEQALAIREKAHGEQSPEVARDLVYIALCHLVKKDDDARTASDLLERARTIYEKTGDHDSAAYGSLLQVEALCSLFQHKVEGAEQKFQQLIAFRERNNGPDDTSTAKILMGVGTIHMLQAQPPMFVGLDEALEDLHKALETRENLKENLKAAINKFDTQEERRKEGEKQAASHAEKARACFERALKIREEKLGPNHPKVAESLLQLATLAYVRERPSDAEEPLRRWLDISKAENRPFDEHTAFALLGFADTALNRGDYEEADRRVIHAQKAIEHANGPGKERLVEADSMRFQIAMKQGCLDRAQSLIRRELTKAEAEIAPDDPDLIQTRKLLATGFEENRDNPDASDLWLQQKEFADALWLKDAGRRLPQILEEQAKLLRKSNRVTPNFTYDDLKYLKALNAVRDHQMVEFFYEIRDLQDQDTQLSDEGLAHIRGLVNLQNLSLRGSKVTDAGLAHLKYLRRLESVDLLYTAVEGSGLKNLASHPKLRSLELSHTKIDDSAIETLARFPALRELSILHTQITPQGAEKLQRLCPNLTIHYANELHNDNPFSPEQKKRILEALDAQGHDVEQPQYVPNPEPAVKPPLPLGLPHPPKRKP